MADRKSISKNFYMVPNEDGKLEEKKSPEATATIVRTTFTGGSTFDLDAVTLSDSIRHCAMLQGLSIKLQRSFADAKGNVSEAEDMYLTVKENLENGIWNSEREGGGPRISLLIDAVMRTLVEAKRVDSVDNAERRESVKGKLLTEEGRKTAMNDVKVQAHYEDIRLDKARERAKAAKDAAKGQAVSEGLSTF